jgi:hypothetical protein
LFLELRLAFHGKTGEGKLQLAREFVCPTFHNIVGAEFDALQSLMIS